MDDSSGGGEDSSCHVPLARVGDDTMDDDFGGGSKVDSGCPNGTEDSGCSDGEDSGCRD